MPRIYVEENRQGEKRDQSHDFRSSSNGIYFCSANITNILANISYIGRQLSPLPGEFPLNPVKRIISHEEIRIINFFKCSSSRFVFVTLLFSTISVV